MTIERLSHGTRTLGDPDMGELLRTRVHPHAPQMTIGGFDTDTAQAISVSKPETGKRQKLRCCADHTADPDAAPRKD